MEEPVYHGRETKDVEAMTEQNALRRRAKDAERTAVMAMRAAETEQRRFKALVRVLAGGAVVGCVIKNLLNDNSEVLFLDEKKNRSMADVARATIAVRPVIARFYR